jgi:hypothetical protein
MKPYMKWRVVAVAGICFLLRISLTPGLAEQLENNESGIRMGYDIARRYCEKPGIPWETDDDDICKKAENDLTPVALGFAYRRWVRAALSEEVTRAFSSSEETHKFQDSAHELADAFQRMADAHYNQMQIIKKLLRTFSERGLIDPVPPFEQFCIITQSDCSKHRELVERWRRRISPAPN